MNRYKYSTLVMAAVAVLTSSSCKKSLDINTSPNQAADAPLSTIYSGAAVNVGFTGGSDLNRYTSLIMQQYGGQSTGGLTQTQQYEQYLIQPSDLDNLWSSFYTNTLVNLNIVISKGEASGSPHYAGVAKLLEAYTFGIMVDTWGKIPYSEALKLTANTQPHYDDDATIYNALLTMIDSGISDINATNSGPDVISGSPIYPGSFSTTKAQWIQFANTLKLRLLLHMSKKDPSGTATKIAALINSGATFMSSNSDSFTGTFTSTSNAQNPIYQFDKDRAGYIVANNTIVTLMNNNNDPRRATYFTQYPVGSGKYVGSIGGSDPSATYSKLGTYLEGTAGEAPIRMLTYAEYNFIRAEAALTMGATGDAQAFYQAGITASMQDAGVVAADIATYIAAHGTLPGTSANQLSQIIYEKYIANFGVVEEPWTDWRRTGYPAITPPANAVINYVPRSLYYPQTEIDLNPNATQKPNMAVRVFWDVQ